MPRLLEPVEDLEVARALFDERGHVAIAGLHSAAQAAEARKAHYTIFGRQFEGNAGTTFNLRSVAMLGYGKSVFHDIYHGMVDGASIFDVGLLPETGYKPRIQLVSIMPGHEGRRHKDGRNLGPLTAVTNLEGTSRLDIWGNEQPEGYPQEQYVSSYRLEPGIVAYMRGKELAHQGVNDGEAERTGLVVTTELIHP